MKISYTMYVLLIVTLVGALDIKEQFLKQQTVVKIGSYKNVILRLVCKRYLALTAMFVGLV